MEVKLDGALIDRLKRIIDEADRTTAKVGFFPSAKYLDGTPIAYVASIQELGCPQRSIPARPFMRPTADAQGKNWRQLIRDGMQAALSGDMSVHDVMEGVGMQAAGDIRKTIAEVSSPPLSPVTIMLRSMKKDRPDMKITGKTVGAAAAMVAAGEQPANVSVKPLVDTGALQAHVTHVVEVAGE